MEAARQGLLRSVSIHVHLWLISPSPELASIRGFQPSNSRGFSTQNAKGRDGPIPSDRTSRPLMNRKTLCAICSVIARRGPPSPASLAILQQ